MEILSLMCQLLAARTSLIAAEKYMPDDLIEGAASIIFCAKRLPIPELTDVWTHAPHHACDLFH